MISVLMSSKHLPYSRNTKRGKKQEDKSCLKDNLFAWLKAFKSGNWGSLVYFEGFLLFAIVSCSSMECQEWGSSGFRSGLDATFWQDKLVKGA